MAAWAILPIMHRACSFTSDEWVESSTKLTCNHREPTIFKLCHIYIDSSKKCCHAHMLTACISCDECFDIIASISIDLLNKFRSKPSVFIMTLESESLSNFSTRSVPKVLMILLLIASSACKQSNLKANHSLAYDGNFYQNLKCHIHQGPAAIQSKRRVRTFS